MGLSGLLKRGGKQESAALPPAAPGALGYLVDGLWDQLRVSVRREVDAAVDRALYKGIVAAATLIVGAAVLAVALWALLAGL